jgi:hypothetical protein
LSLYRSGALTTAARVLGRYKLDLVGVQEVRWDKEGTVRTGDYIFFLYGKGNEIYQLGTAMFLHHSTVSAVKKLKFVSVRMSYIVLRGCWCDIIILNMNAPSVEKTDDSKGGFCEQVFNHFPKYHMKILLGDLNSKVGIENIFKPTIGNESLH